MSTKMPKDLNSNSTTDLPVKISIEAYKSAMSYNCLTEFSDKKTTYGSAQSARMGLSLVDELPYENYKLVKGKFANTMTTRTVDLTGNTKTVVKISSAAHKSCSSHSEHPISRSNDTLVESVRSSPSLTSNRAEESVIGKYKLMKTIGEGGYGQVKLSKDLVTGEEIAIKIIEKTNLSNYAVKKLFTEVTIMKLLDHPNIVRLLDVIDTEKSLYLVMEYISGGDLFDFRQRHGRLKEEMAREIFRQIVTAVDYCHYKGVVHRDLKEENILLDSKMNVKITDFGLSSQLTPGDHLDSLCGTIRCMAPEILLAQKYGPEVDVWSLGVILYSLVAGRCPFGYEESSCTIDRILQCSYIIPQYMSTECANLLKNIFVLNPVERVKLKFIMKDEWLNQGYKDNELKPYVEPKEKMKDAKEVHRLWNAYIWALISCFIFPRFQ